MPSWRHGSSHRHTARVESTNPGVPLFATIVLCCFWRTSSCKLSVCVSRSTGRRPNSPRHSRGTSAGAAKARHRGRAHVCRQSTAVKGSYATIEQEDALSKVHLQLAVMASMVDCAIHWRDDVVVVMVQAGAERFQPQVQADPREIEQGPQHPYAHSME